MDSFLEKYIPLVNKNTPIIISYGEFISDNIFNKKCSKKTIDSLIQKITSIENIKYKVNHKTNVAYYKSNNYIYKVHNHNLECQLYTIKDRFNAGNLLAQYINTQTDQFITPSIYTFDSIQNVNIMSISLYNSVDVNVTDFTEYYTIDIVLKKPLQLNILLNLIKNINKL
tara:strand:+ start:5041 stop:5550 length:510 start_codon:yes stop_codon:yes gene_type:complete